MKHEIDIPVLPEGWDPVAFRCPNDGESYVGYDGKVIISLSTNDLHGPRLIVKKKQPRRIVLEETDEENHRYASGTYATYSVSRSMLIGGTKMKWREVNETDLSLHNVDDKESLRLSVDDARELLNYIPSGTEFHKKIVDFIWAKKNDSAMG